MPIDPKVSSCSDNQVRSSRLVPLPDLLHLVGASYPKMDAVGNDPCGAHYRDL